VLLKQANYIIVIRICCANTHAAYFFKTLLVNFVTRKRALFLICRSQASDVITSKLLLFTFKYAKTACDEVTAASMLFSGAYAVRLRTNDIITLSSYFSRSISCELSYWKCANELT